MGTQTTQCPGSLGRRALPGRAGEQRSVLRGTQRAALRVLLPTVLLVVLAGCAPFPPPPPPRPTATPVDCATTLRCRVVLPRCGPAVTPEQSNMGIWFARFYLPHNAASLVGFQPLVPTWIPRGASWYKAVLVQAGAESTPTQPVLFHAGYGPWPPRENSALRGLDSASVLTLDESTDHLDPLSDLIGENQVVRIQSQQATTVAGQPATIYHLDYSLSSTLQDTYVAIEVLWHAGPLTLRVLGIPSLSGVPLHVFPPNPRQGDIDELEAWTNVAGADQTGDDDGVLLHLAASVVPYSGCGSA